MLSSTGVTKCSHITADFKITRPYKKNDLHSNAIFIPYLPLKIAMHIEAIEVDLQVKKRCKPSVCPAESILQIHRIFNV